MFSHFPAPYPGELFYSMLSRYAKRIPEIDEYEIIKEIFNEKMSELGKSIPFSIQVILDKLKIFNYISEVEVINHHTLYNFFYNFYANSFLPDAVLFGNNKGTRVVSNGMNLKDSPLYFRYCPKCVEEDFEKYGETYWKALFQLPTVMICQEHNILLKNSSVSFFCKGLVPASANNCTDDTPSTSSHITSRTRMILLLLAKESEKLSQGKLERNILFDNKNLTLSTLKSKGLLDRLGNVKEKELKDCLFTYYGVNLSQIIMLDVDNFVEEFCRSGYQLNYFKSVEKLLFIFFLSGSINNFLNTTIVIPGNENVIQKCHNKYCQQKVNLQIYPQKDEKMRIKVTILSYSCNCGLVFKSIYGDQDVFINSQRYYYLNTHLEKVILTEIYINQQSILDVAKKLSINPIQIEFLLHEHFKEEKVTSNMIKEYRKKWENLVHDNMEMHYLELKYNSLLIFTWLYRNDYRWLNEMNEKLKNNKLSTSFVRKRDKLLKEYLRDKLHRLLLYQYKGRQISIWMAFPFIRESYLKSELAYFPETLNYLARLKRIHDKYHDKQLKEIRGTERTTYFQTST